MGVFYFRTLNWISTVVCVMTTAAVLLLLSSVASAQFWASRGTDNFDLANGGQHVFGAGHRFAGEQLPINDILAAGNISDPIENRKGVDDDLGGAACSTVIIRKEVVTADGTGSSTVAFGFSATANLGVTSFSLVDDNSGPGQDSRIAQPNLAAGTTATITVTELPAPTGWTLINVDCTETMTQDSTRNSVGPATINLQAGEVVICTFTNSGLGVTAAPADIGGRVVTSAGAGISGAILTLTNVSTGEVRTTMSNNLGHYKFTNVMTDDVYTVSVWSKRHTFSDASRTFTLRENVSDLNFVASSTSAGLASDGRKTKNQ